MRRRIVTTVVLLAAVVWGAPPASATAAPRQQVEVCFVLDTTGSMSGLLDAAKQKIWFIASEIVSAPSRPDVRFCLLAFRDRGDAYVTRHHDLTRDLDDIYAELVALQADGGGDTPEAVNQALDEAVENTAWSPGADALKVIFLVGDAPPQTGYDERQYPEIAARAAARGILINPVVCGDSGPTRSAFEAIARLGGGESAVLPQPGRVRRIETPVDQDLAALGQRLGRTAIPYGGGSDADSESMHLAETLDHATAADRAAFTAASGRVHGGDGDLIEALDAGRVTLDMLDPARLPPTLRSLTEQELIAHLATVRSEREGLRRVIASLLEERRTLLAAHADASSDAGFDAVVSAIVRRQLASTPKRTER